MNKKQFEEIKNELRITLDINDKNLQEKNYNLPTVYQDFLEIYIHEISILQNLQEKYNVLKAEKHIFYKFKYEYKLSSQTEIETAIRGDKAISSLIKDLHEQENYVKFLENSLANIKNTNYLIKNAIDIQRLQDGY